MKRLFLLFAVIALASCVKENNLTPELESQNNVTIKAVAGDSKTLLNGTDVVWEQNDKIAVVLDKTLAEFTIAEFAESEATFGGYIDPELTYTTAYAVYPATAYSYDGSTDHVTLTHTLPEVQTGDVSGLNFSSAKLSVEGLKEGTAEALFENALALVQVIVPDGVTEVSLTSGLSYPALVGKATASVNTATGGAVLSGASNHTVTLKTDEALTAGTYPLLVYPANNTTLTLKMLGTDGAQAEGTLEGVRLEAGKYYTIDLEEVLQMHDDKLYVVKPAGDEFEVTLATTLDKTEYTVTCPDWIKYEVVETKAFHAVTIKFNVDPNTAGENREGNVTIAWGNGKSKSFKVEQKEIFMDFVYTEENPIEWEETFGLYGSENDANNGTNAVKTHTNTFRITLSDELNKGTYKVSNMFKADNYYDNNNQTVSNKGGEYFADYENGVLKVKMENAVRSYYFADIELSYSTTDKTFSAGLIPYGASNFLAAGFIGGYQAVVKVEKPAEPEQGESTDPIVGEWNVSCKFTANVNNALTAQTGTMKIVKSGDSYEINEFMGVSVSWQLSQSGNKFTCAALMNSETYEDGATFEYNEENKTLAVSGVYTDWQYVKFSDFTATHK